MFWRQWIEFLNCFNSFSDFKVENFKQSDSTFTAFKHVLSFLFKLWFHTYVFLWTIAWPYCVSFVNDFVLYCLFNFRAQKFTHFFYVVQIFFEFLKTWLFVPSTQHYSSFCYKDLYTTFDIKPTSIFKQKTNFYISDQKMSVYKLQHTVFIS